MKIKDQINAKHSLTELIHFKNNRAECLNGGNTTSPSLEYYPLEETAFCHKCKRIYDFIGVYAELNNMDYYSSLKEIAAQDGIAFGEVDQKFIDTRKAVQECFQYFMKITHEELKKSEYWNEIKKKRNLTDKTMNAFKIGLFNHDIREKMIQKYKKELLYEAGFLFESGKFLCGDRFVIPYLDHNGEATYFGYRVIDAKPDHRKNKKGESIKYVKQNIAMKDESGVKIKDRDHVKNSVFGFNTLHITDKPLIITEGFYDAISVYQAGYPVISPISVRFKQDDLSKVANICKRYDKTIVVMDNEENKAGLNGSEDTLKALMELGVNIYIGVIPNLNNLPKIDLNDFFLENPPEAFEDLILFEAIEGFDYVMSFIDNDTDTKRIQELVFDLIPTDDFIKQDEIFKTIGEKKKVDSRKVAKQYREYMKKKLKQETIKEKTTVKDVLIPEEFKEKVETFLTSETKFEDIKEILDFYITREDQNKMLSFILLSGSYFGLYTIIAVIGQSSGGKTWVIENVLKIFLDEDYKILTAASDKYLQYLAMREDFSLLIIFFNEAQRNTRIIEQMKDFGDDGIKYGTLLKDKQGNHYPVDLNLGKLSIVITTTKEDVNLEFLSRAWKLEPDETETQNKAIVDIALERKKSPWNRDKNETKIKEKIETIRHALETIKIQYKFKDIAIPFSDSLKSLLKMNTIQVRRDKDKLIDLIKRITAWNFKNRDYIEKNGKKYLIAHPNDLKIALKYGKETFVNMTKNLTSEKIKILNRMIQMKGRAENDVKWRSKQILIQLKKHNEFSSEKRTLERRLKSLADHGYIEIYQDSADKRCNVYECLETELVRNDGDIQKIITNATIEYNEFIKDLEKNKQITLQKKQITNLKYSEVKYCPKCHSEMKRFTHSNGNERVELYECACKYQEVIK